MVSKSEQEKEEARIVKEYQSLVRKIANRYRFLAPPHEYESLIQEGTIALIQAYRRYDPTKAALATFATWHIKARLRILVIKLSATISAGDTNKIRTAFYKIKSGEVDPRNQEQMTALANTLDIDPNALFALYAPNLALDDQEQSYHDYMCGSTSFESSSHDKIDAAVIKTAVAQLPKRYRYVLMQWFYNEKSFQQIAEELGCSRSQVHLLKNKALTILKQQLTA
jgi:RNA polymerase sigma factor for flagellar operon FliA